MSSNEITKITNTAQALLACAKNLVATSSGRDLSPTNVPTTVIEHTSSPTDIILILDATASRENDWAKSLADTDELFNNLLGTSGNVSASLFFYAGGKIFQTAPKSTAQELVMAAHKIVPVGGLSQIEETINCAIKSHAQRPVSSVVLVADSCEENCADVTKAALKLKMLGIRLFIFDDGERSTNRHASTKATFTAISEAVDGVYSTFAPHNFRELAALMSLVRADATGDRAALEIAGKSPVRSISSVAGRLLALPTPKAGG